MTALMYSYPSKDESSEEENHGSELSKSISDRGKSKGKAPTGRSLRVTRFINEGAKVLSLSLRNLEPMFLPATE